MTGELLAVCVVHATLPDPGGEVGVTAIDKRAVSGPIHVHSLGLDGDRQEDLENHGGRDQALYAYAEEDRQWWSDQVGREITPGGFGENLVTRGVDVNGAVIGQTWRVGECIVQVTGPRIPCATFQRFVDQPHWVKRFTDEGRPGAYLRVVTEGPVAAGDSVELVETPVHGVTVRDVFAGRRGDREALRRLLAEGDDLAPSVVDWVERELRVGDDQQT